MEPTLSGFVKIDAVGDRHFIEELYKVLPRLEPGFVVIARGLVRRSLVESSAKDLAEFDAVLVWCEESLLPIGGFRQVSVAVPASCPAMLRERILDLIDREYPEYLASDVHSRLDVL